MQRLTSTLVGYGLETPMKRGIAGLITGMLYDVMLQPSWANTADGIRRNSYYAEQPEDGQITGTYLPTGSTGLILGAFLYFFL